MALLLALAACGKPVDGTGDTDTDTTVDTDPGTDTENPTEVDAILALDGDTTAGAQIYADNCQLCHMADGTGNGTAQDFTAGLPEDAVAVTAILDGVDGTQMVAFGDFLSDQDIADVWAYIKASFGP